MEKAIIFDSGTLITLSMSDLLEMLRKLKQNFGGKFIITREVEEEIVTKPMKIKKFKLGAIRLKKLIEDKTLEFPDVFGISQNEISKIANSILKDANAMFIAQKRPVHIIDLGEASIMALSKLLRNKKIANLIAMDERTTRMLCEKPQNLERLLSKKLHMKIIQQKQGNRDFYRGDFIRSTELIFIAYKKGILPKNKELLDAMLYAAKFKGAAISSEEIKVMEKL